LGRNGALGTGGSGHIHVPAFLSPVVDTMGAGDAFFAITACIAQEADMRSLLTIGNAAGKLKGQIVGHRKAVTKHELLDFMSEHS